MSIFVMDLKNDFEWMDDNKLYLINVDKVVCGGDCVYENYLYLIYVYV